MATYAKIKTSSNFQNLNGKFILVEKFLGTIVYGSFVNGDGEFIKADFNLSEVVEIIEVNDVD